VSDLDAAIHERLAIDEDGHYFRYDSEMIQRAVFAGLELHAAGYPGNEVEVEWRNEPAYDKGGKLIGYLPVKAGPVPPYWCNTCQEMAPCPTVLAIAKGLGIEP